MVLERHVQHVKECSMQMHTELTKAEPHGHADRSPIGSRISHSLYIVARMVSQRGTVLIPLSSAVSCNSLDGRRPANLHTALVTWYARASK
jgi:hypothetical protein